MSFSSSTVLSSEESSSEPPGNSPSGSQKTEEVVVPNDNLDADADQEPITFSSPAFSYVTPKVYLRRLPFGIGMFAKEQIKKDEVVIGWAGRVVHVNDVLAMPEDERTYILQIDEELFQVPFWPGYNEPADFTNHSCDPNCGFGNSPVSLVAMRDIQIGEQMTFDYAMSECIEDLPGNCDWDCLCGASCCRGKFRGADWRLPELWVKYKNYFSPYLRRKIANLVASKQGEGFGLNPEVVKAVKVMYESIQPMAALEGMFKRSEAQEAERLQAAAGAPAMATAN